MTSRSESPTDDAPGATSVTDAADDAAAPPVLYFDTETCGYGGFRPPTQRLVQIAWMFGDRAVDYLIEDVERINPEVPHPHSVEDCRKRGVPFRTAFDAFMADVRACDRVVAHNLAFDRGILENELRLRRLDATELSGMMDSKGFCTMASTTDLCRLPPKSKFVRGYKYPRLEELYVHLFERRPSVGLHDAYNDTTVLRECHETLLARGLVVS